MYTAVLQVNSALHPSGVAKSSTSFGWGKGGNVTSAGWQVTLCDPIWHVSSNSGVATLRTAIHLLLTYLLTYLLLLRAVFGASLWRGGQPSSIQQLLVAWCMDDHHRPVRVSWCEHRARETQPVNALDEMSARRTSVSADRPLPASRRPELTRSVEI